MNIRKLFIDYFVKNQHVHVDSSPLVPANDKSLLFTNSGMVQFKDIFLGIQKPKNKRIVTCQKCVRAGGKHNDLENIGYTNRHHSFFEMLGNFSFGDYFKEEAIFLAWKFLTEELSLDKERLYISVNKNDQEAADIWLNQIKVKKDKIWYLDDVDNFWQMGSTGPCGPCSEIYYDLGEKLKGSFPGVGDTGERFIEIWNLVFTQYNRDKNGKLNDLPEKCVDTGMGLERIHAVVEGKTDNFKTSIFLDLEKYLDKSLDTTNINYTIKKIIMDHCRSACFLIADGIIPSNEGRGYVLRRIIRRATRFLYNSGIQEPFIYTCTRILKKSMGSVYQELSKKEKLIKNTLMEEEENYLNTLSKGLELINKLTKNKNELSGENIFKLYDTYGFPSEIIQEIATEKGLKLDVKEFDRLMKKQKSQSRKSSNFYIKDASFIDTKLKTKFVGYKDNSSLSTITTIYHNKKNIKSFEKKDEDILITIDTSPFYPEGGGQISDTGVMENKKTKLSVLYVQKINNVIIHTVRVVSGKLSIGDKLNSKIDDDKRKKITINHSSTHLLNQALRDTLGEHVEQKGSLVTDKYLRFDFSHNKALSESEIFKIESIISFEINSSRVTTQRIMPYKDAIKDGALAFFDEKYDDKVRVVNIGTKSMELCGGTHVNNTSEIRLFKIISESSVSAGIRRIEAITADSAFQSYQSIFNETKELSKILNAKSNNIQEKIISLKNNHVVNESQLVSLNKTLAGFMLKSLVPKINTSSNTNLFIEDCPNITSEQIKILSDLIKSKFNNSISIFTIVENNKISCYVGVSKLCKHLYNAKQIVEKINKKFSSKGGGSNTFATTIIPGKEPKKVLNYLRELL